MSLYHVQPQGTQNPHRSDYLLKTVRSGLTFQRQSEAIDRLSRRLVASELVDHHGMPPVLDAELDRAPFFLVEPFAEGYSLHKVRERAKSVSLSKVIWIARQIAEVIAAAHNARKTHLGINPEKIIVDETGRVVVNGWSNSHHFGSRCWLPWSSIAEIRLRAPECFLADYQAQPAADVYALGVAWYWLFSGSWPVTGPSMEVLQQQHQQVIPGELSCVCPWIPTELSRLIHMMLAKNPIRRPGIHTVLEKMFSIEIDYLHDGRAINEIAV